jgi:cytoskeletal protein CcmA (bactofilin family)
MYKKGYLGRVRPRFDAVAVAILLLLVVFPNLSKAMDLRAGRRIAVPAGEVVSGNLYAAASELTVSGVVDGDLVAAGGDVFLQGKVIHDVSIAGGQAQIGGYIGGDLRVACGQVDLTGEVTGDLVIAGGRVRMMPGAKVGGDTVVAGGELLIEGTLAKSLRAAGGDVILNGTVSGPVQVRSSRLEVGEKANLEGALVYFTPDEAVIHEGAKIAGPITFHLVSGMDQGWIRRGLRRLGLAFYLIGLVTTLLAGLLACIFLRRPSQALVGYALSNFGKELLRGFVFFFVMPAAIFLLTVSVIGVPFAFLAGLMHLGFGIIAVVFTGIAVGTLLLKLVRKKEEYEVSWKAALVGIPLVYLVFLVPVVGFFANAIFFLAVFGAIYQRFWTGVRAAL